MERFSRVVLAHRRRALGALLLLLLGGAASVVALLGVVTERNDYPGLPAYEANLAIHAAVGTGGYERPVVAVVAGADDAVVTSALERVGDRTGSRVATNSALSSEDTVLGLVFGAPVERGGLPGSALGEGGDLSVRVGQLLRAELPAATVQVTGLDTLATGADSGGLNIPVKLGITLAAAFAVLLWMLRSRLAVVPLATALVAVPASFLGLLAVSPLLAVHETTLMMLPLLGVGLAVDYALIVVSRWREEAAHDGDPVEATHRAMGRAGRAVLVSAAAVALGLGTMLLLPIPLLVSLGVGGLLVTAASAVVTLVLLPVLLARQPVPAPELPRRFWFSWTRVVVRHRVLAAVLAGGLLLGLAGVATELNLHVPVTADLADSGPGRDGLDALTAAGLPAGALTAFDVFLPAGTDPAGVAGELAGVDGAHTVLSPSGPDWRSAAGSVVTVVPEGEGAAGRATIEAARAAVEPGVLVGGNVAQQEDYLDAAYGAFPWVLGLVSLTLFLVLSAAFRAPLLALKAVLLNLLSLAAVLGALVLLWQWGWGTEALLGITPDGAVGTFVPITVFAFLLGLTTDYEVLILSRIREAHRRGLDTTEAVVDGVGRSGRLVTAAALVLFLSFAAMAFTRELDVAVFASGVALGILLDATLVRAVLAPSVVALLGRSNWWMPRLPHLLPGTGRRRRHAAMPPAP